jgi:beta-N-acetylhexosaminidase
MRATFSLASRAKRRRMRQAFSRSRRRLSGFARGNASHSSQLRDLNREDLAPYRELRNELPMVMVNHAAYPRNAQQKHARQRIALLDHDRSAQAHRLSRHHLLRRLGDGRHSQIHVHRRGRHRRHSRGMSMIEICHTPELILRAYEALLAEAERSAAFSKLLIARAQQTARQRAKLFASGVSPALTAKQFEALRARILRFAETIKEAQTA